MWRESSLKASLKATGSSLKASLTATGYWRMVKTENIIKIEIIFYYSWLKMIRYEILTVDSDSECRAQTRLTNFVWLFSKFLQVNRVPYVPSYEFFESID